jgi:hypothetical protein
LTQDDHCQAQSYIRALEYAWGTRLPPTQMNVEQHEISKEEQPISDERNSLDNEKGITAKSEVKRKRRKLVPLKKTSLDEHESDKQTSFFRLRHESVEIENVKSTGRDVKVELKREAENEEKTLVERHTNVSNGDIFENNIEHQDETISVIERTSQHSIVGPNVNEILEPPYAPGPHDPPRSSSISIEVLSDDGDEPAMVDHSIEVLSDDEIEGYIFEDGRESSELIAEEPFSDSLTDIQMTSKTSPASGELDELDPKLRERIEERKRQRAAQIHTPFKVDLTITSAFEEMSSEPLNVEIQSTDSFRGLKDYYVSFMVNYFNCDHDSHIYTALENCIFIWNGIQIFEFSTPYSLNVTEEDNHMSITATSIEQFKMSRRNLLKTLEEEASDDDLILNQYATQEGKEEDNDGDGYFKIKLQASEGGPLEVAVNADTEIKKLAEFFLQKRKMDPSTNIRLEFDDEPLNLNSRVGDTELEEDYIVDVIL